MKKTMIATMLIAAASLAGCRDRNDRYAKKQAEALDRRADRVEQRGKEEATHDANVLREKADVIREGVKYEVMKIDRPGQNIVIRAFNEKKADTLEDKALQAGHEKTLSYGELEKFDTQHHAGAEIADKLNTGDKVTVFMDANGNITKIDF